MSNKEGYKLGDLSGAEGNAFVIMSYVQSCMKKEGRSEQELESYYQEATESDYANLVKVSKKELVRLNNLAKLKI